LWTTGPHYTVLIENYNCTRVGVLNFNDQGEIMKNGLIISIFLTSLSGLFLFCSEELTTEPEPINIPPECVISWPVDSTNLVLGDKVEIHVNANDQDGQVTQVKFFIDDQLRHVDYVSLSSFLWETSNETPGEHSIRVETVDDDNTTGSSSSVSVTLSISIHPANLDSVYTSGFTRRIISDNFIFHYAPGDTVWVERSEAFHDWAVNFLDVDIWKKIDYYKFPSREDLGSALGLNTTISGVAFPSDCAVGSVYSWHNHEYVHIYVYFLLENPTTLFFNEGIAVALEVDPYNSEFRPGWYKSELGEPYIYPEKIREFIEEGSYVPIEDFLECEAFIELYRIDYPKIYVEAGMFVHYLIETYGLEKVIEMLRSVVYQDTKETIMTEFERVFGKDILVVESEWHSYLQGTPFVEKVNLVNNNKYNLMLR
jgi:hypothetical protein